MIYLMDALEDLKEDYVAGDFNPCVVQRAGGAAEISPSRVEVAIERLEGTQETIGVRLAQLPLRRHQEVLEGILSTVADRSVAAIAQARAWAAEEERTRLAIWKAQPLHTRVWIRTSQVALFFWLWFGSVPQALAHNVTHPEKDFDSSKWKSWIEFWNLSHCLTDIEWAWNDIFSGRGDVPSRIGQAFEHLIQGCFYHCIGPPFVECTQGCFAVTLSFCCWFEDLPSTEWCCQSTCDMDNCKDAVN